MSNKKTPLEETFNLPSMKELEEDFNNENSESEENDHDEDDYLEKDDSGNVDYENMTPKEIKQYIDKTKKELAKLEQFEKENQLIESYHSDVDKIHDQAMSRFNEIMDVALSMEASQGARFLSAAAKLLDTALNAKNSGIDRQMKMAELQMKKEEHDDNLNKKDPREVSGYEHYDDAEEEVDETEVVGDYDRNSLLKRMPQDDENE